VLFIDFLLAKLNLIDQVAVAGRSHRGKFKIRLCLGQHRASVTQLLVDLRRLDYCEELSFCVPALDICIPNAKIAVIRA